MRTTATILGNLRLTIGQLMFSTLVLLGLMLPIAWALKAVNVMANVLRPHFPAPTPQRTGKNRDLIPRWPPP